MPKKPLDDFNGFHQLAMTHILVTGLELTIQRWYMEPHHASVFLATVIQDCNQLQPLNPDFASEICNEWGKFDPHTLTFGHFEPGSQSNMVSPTLLVDKSTMAVKTATMTMAWRRWWQH